MPIAVMTSLNGLVLTSFEWIATTTANVACIASVTYQSYAWPFAAAESGIVEHQAQAEQERARQHTSFHGCSAAHRLRSDCKRNVNDRFFYYDPFRRSRAASLEYVEHTGSAIGAGKTSLEDFENQIRHAEAKLLRAKNTSTQSDDLTYEERM